MLASCGRQIPRPRKPRAIFGEGRRIVQRRESPQRRRGALGPRGGFVEVALSAGAPIVPVAVVGSEEIYPKIAESRALAKATGAPFFPLTPTFPWLGLAGLVPLPSRWRIEFCEPIDLSQHGPDAADDRRVVFDVSEQVRETIQHKLYENLAKRPSAFL